MPMLIFTGMKQNNYNVIGVMSGTSLDGIDLAFVNFNRSQSWSYRIMASQTIPYPKKWQEILKQSLFYDEQEMQSLNRDYTFLLSKVILEFIRKNEITSLNAVCSHGHTIKHEPENAYTLQIGNLPALAELTGQTVVCDFRVQDVQLGGQGAPLVPIGDELLFSEYDYCLNLGGFGNISTSREGTRLAYDICAVNTVLNFLAAKAGREYDKDGELAASGKLDVELLKKLNSLPFYTKPAPKSLGIEWVNKNIFPLLKDISDIPSALHTYVIHAAEQIVAEIGTTSEAKVLITGGGTFNKFLIDQIGQKTRSKIIIPSEEVVNYKEALIFAFLGVLKMREEINVLSSVTGASKDHSSGVVFRPTK